MAEKHHKFTKRSIELLTAPTAQKPAVFYDTEQPGLGIRVQPSGKKTFFVMKQMRGRLHRQTLGNCSEWSVEQARAETMNKLAAMVDWKRDGFDGPAPLDKPMEGLTFANSFEAYISGAVIPKAQKRGKDPTAAEGRVRWLFKSYLKPLHNRQIESIGEDALARLHSELTQDKGPFAANRALEIVRAVYRYLIRKRLATFDPTQNVDMNTEKARDRFLQPEELPAFFKALDDEPNRDAAEFVALLLATGVRKSNLYAAAWENFDFVLAQWNIPGEQSKNGQPLAVELIPEAIEILKRRRARSNGGRWVFPSATSESGHVVDFKSQFKRVLKRAGLTGLKNVRFHDLRRSFASFLALAGVSLPTIGASLGHKSAKSTEVYAKLHRSAVRQGLVEGRRLMQAMRKQAEREAKRQQKLLLTAGN